MDFRGTGGRALGDGQHGMDLGNRPRQLVAAIVIVIVIVLGHCAGLPSAYLPSLRAPNSPVARPLNLMFCLIPNLLGPA